MVSSSRLRTKLSPHRRVPDPPARRRRIYFIFEDPADDRGCKTMKRAVAANRQRQLYDEEKPRLWWNSDQRPEFCCRMRGALMDPSTVVKSVTVGKPRDEVYAFWRDFKNLERFMENIARIDILDTLKSHWVVKAPAGRRVEWDAEITADEPGRRIAWASAPGADVENSGVVEFKDAPGGRGTEIHAHIVYKPPGGALGEILAKVLQKEPGLQAHRDLRRLKMLLETGEIADTDAPDAAPRARAGPV